MELARKDESTANKWKVIMVEIIFKSQVNKVTYESSDCGNVDTIMAQKQPRELVNTNPGTLKKKCSVPFGGSVVKRLTLDFSSGIDLRVMGSSPTLGFKLGMEPP